MFSIGCDVTALQRFLITSVTTTTMITLTVTRTVTNMMRRVCWDMSDVLAVLVVLVDKLPLHNDPSDFVNMSMTWRFGTRGVYNQAPHSVWLKDVAP